MDQAEKWGTTVEEAVELALKDLELTRDQVEVEVLEEPTKGFLGIGSKLAKVRVMKKSLTGEANSAGQGKAAKSDFVASEDVTTDGAAKEEASQSDAEEVDAFGRTADQRPSFGKIDLRSPAGKAGETASQGGSVTHSGGRDRGGRGDRRGGRSDVRLTNANTEAISVKPDDLQPLEAHEALDFLRETTKNMGLALDVKAEANDEFMYITLEGDDAGAIIGKRGQTLDAIQYLTSLVVNKDHEEYTRVVIDAENYRAKREKTLQQLAIRLGTKALRTGRPVRLEPMNPYERMVIHATLHTSGEVVTRSEGDEPYRRVIIEKK